MVIMDIPCGDSGPKTCVVLGGRGFVGRSLVSRLLQLGNWIVRVADSANSLLLDSFSESDSLLAEAISAGCASYHHVDVHDKSRIAQAIEGSYVVFYMEPSDLDADDFYQCHMVIVQGAKNVINACRECKVRQLIYNSSADVVFDGSEDIHDGDESLTCPWKFPGMLIDLKAQAEALILFANNIDGLLTCVLRPSNVYGPGDTQIVPFLVNLAKSGWGKFIIGSGENMSDFTYAENVAHAHICATGALDSRTMLVAGKAFFITDLKHIKFWDFVSQIREGLGYGRPSIKLPARMAWYILLLLKWADEKLGFRISSCSDSARYIVKLASRTRTFNCNAAQKHIGYSPVISPEEGLALTVESFSHLAKNSSFTRYSNFTGPSKADKLLGGGEVADILLWRDEKRTFTCFFALVALFYWFFLSGRTFTSSAAQFLLLVEIIYYGYGILPPEVRFSFLVKSIYLSSFEIPESVTRDSVRTLACLWNTAVNNTRSLAKGDNWGNFFKVAVSLYLLKLIVSWPLRVLIGLVLALSFTALFMYEQYETEIDGLARLVLTITTELTGVLIRNLPASIAPVLHKYGILRQPKAPTVIQD